MLKTSNVITQRKNRFNSNTIFERKDNKSFCFEKGLKSVNLKSLHFINFAKFNDEPEYDTVINMFIRYVNADMSFLDDFVGDELIPDYKTDRLLNIINEVQKAKYTSRDLPTIMKLNNINFPALHFFIKNSRNNATLILIDLYHLGIYGRYIHKGKEIKQNLEKVYKRNKHNTLSLEDILAIK